MQSEPSASGDLKQVAWQALCLCLGMLVLLLALGLVLVAEVGTAPAALGLVLLCAIGLAAGVVSAWRMMYPRSEGMSGERWFLLVFVLLMSLYCESYVFWRRSDGIRWGSWSAGRPRIYCCETKWNEALSQFFIPLIVIEETGRRWNGGAGHDR